MAPCVCNIDECALCVETLHDGLSKAEACELRGLISKSTYKPHQILCREGAPNEHLIVISCGQVKLSTCLPDGRKQILRVAVAGHMLGFESIRNHVATYTAETITEVATCQIRYADMMRILKQNPQVSVRVIEDLSQELDHSQSLIRDLGLKNSTERTASFILSIMPINGTDVSETILPLSRREIAEILGLTIETVSRGMAKLKRDGIISEPPGRIRIEDRSRLEQIAESNGPR